MHHYFCSASSWRVEGGVDGPFLQVFYHPTTSHVSTKTALLMPWLRNGYLNGRELVGEFCVEKWSEISRFMCLTDVETLGNCRRRGLVNSQGHALSLPTSQHCPTGSLTSGVERERFPLGGRTKEKHMTRKYELCKKKKNRRHVKE